MIAQESGSGPSLDRAVASGTAFERPLPGSAAANSLSQQQQRIIAGGTTTTALAVSGPKASAPLNQTAIKISGSMGGGGGPSFRKINQPTAPRSSALAPDIGAYPIAVAEPPNYQPDRPYPTSTAGAPPTDHGPSDGAGVVKPGPPAAARFVATFRPIGNGPSSASSSANPGNNTYAHVAPTVFMPEDQDAFLPEGGRIIVPTAVTFPSSRTSRPRTGSERAAQAERIKRGLEGSDESDASGSSGRESDDGGRASGSGTATNPSTGADGQPLTGSKNSRKKKRRKQRDAERIAALSKLNEGVMLAEAPEAVDESERRRRSAQDFMLSVPVPRNSPPAVGKTEAAEMAVPPALAPGADESDDEIVEVGSTITLRRVKGLRVKIEDTLQEIQRAIRGLPTIPQPASVEPPLTPAQQQSSGTTAVPPNSGTLSTPSGTILAPISLATTASTASSASLRVPATISGGGKLRASESGTSATSGASRAASSIIASPKQIKQIIEMELSDDDDDDPMDGKGAAAGGDDSDADSVLKMDPITISSSSDEQSDDEMDISVESDGGSTARAAKSRRKQQAGSKTPVSSRVGASSTVAAAKRTPVEYYQGKVEVSQAGINLGVGVAKIMDLGADEYELRLSFKLTANAANGSALQPRPDIVSTKAQLVGARFDEEKRTMSWQLNSARCAVRFVETSSWIQFSKAFGVTLKTVPMPSPGRSPTARMTVGGGPTPQPPVSHSSAGPLGKRPAIGVPSKASSNLFIAQQKRAPVVAASGKVSMATDAPPLERRKIKAPARHGTDDLNLDFDLSARPKKKVRAKPVVVAPPLPSSTGAAKKAAERTRLEEIADGAVNAAKEPTAIRSRASQPTTEFTIDILQCNIGTGKIPQSAVGDLPKQVCVAIRAEMSPDEKYTEGKVTCLKESIYFPEVTFDPSGKKVMTFDPPLQFHMPALLFRTLPTYWPFRADRGYRRGHYVRLKIEFLAFIDKDRRPSQWILDEFGDYNQDDELIDFQCPYAQVPLIRPHRSGDMDRVVSTSNRTQLSIAGVELNPEFMFSFKFQAFWDAAAAANAPETVPTHKERKARPPPSLVQQQATPNGDRSTLAIHPAAVETKQRKGKGRLVLDESEEESEEEGSCADALSSLNITSNGASADASDESRVQTPLERSVSPFVDDEDEYDHDNVRAKQAFTMVFEPKGPTFRPPPERSVPKDSQRIQPGTLAHDLASLDREAVDNEIIEREELIFDIEGIHDGQKFVMALWNRWCSHVDSTLGRIHQINSVSHIMGFINRYFIAMYQKNVRRFFVIHLQVLAAFDLCQNDTFAMALAQYSRLTQQVLKQNGALKAPAV